MIRRILVGATMLLGCRQDAGQPMLMPLAPARPVSFELTVSPQQVAATMVIPANFSVQQMGNIVDAWGAGTQAPRLELQSPPGPLGERVILWDENCRLGDGVGAFQWRVSQRVPEHNGVLFVCVDPETKDTVVVRHFLWEGHPIECTLAFGEVEPAPRAARISEAKDICDSVVLRHPIE